MHNESAFEEHRNIPAGRAENELFPRLKVAAAMGGLLVGSEAGNKQAIDGWERIQKLVNARSGRDRRSLGALVIQLIANPAKNAVMNNQGGDAGSVLSVYLAASAMDDGAYTSWKKPLPVSVHEGAKRTIETAYNTYQNIRWWLGKGPGPHKSTGPKQQDPSGFEYDMGHIDALGKSYLAGYLKRYNLDSVNDEAMLAATYGLVVRRIGALPTFHSNERDIAAGQLIEDFLSSCYRLSGTKDLEKTKSTIKTTLGSLGTSFSEMFESADLLFYQRGIKVKGPGLSVGKKYARFMGNFATTGVKAPSRPLAAEHQALKDILDLHGADGKPRDTGAGSTTYESARQRFLRRSDARGDATTAPPSRPGAGPGARPGSGSGEEHRRPRSGARPPRRLSDLLNADSIDSDLQKIPEDPTTAPTYPWSRILTGILFRQSAGVDLSNTESALYLKGVARKGTLIKLVWRQLLETKSIDRIASSTEVRDDIFAGAVEVHRWLLRKVSGREKIEGATLEEVEQNQANYRKAERQMRESLISHFRLKYGMKPDDKMNLPMFNALSELTTFHLSGVWQDPGSNQRAFNTFWKRLTQAFKGWPLDAAERAFFDRATKAMNPGRGKQGVSVEDLPKDAQELYRYLDERRRGLVY